MPISISMSVSPIEDIEGSFYGEGEYSGGNY